jgi:hypothetical protein
MNKKTCLSCGSEKSINEFSKDKTKRDGLQASCKSCNKTYRSKNKNRIKEYQKEYMVTNHEALLMQKKLYHRNNKKAIWERVRIKLSTDIELKIKKNLRVRLYIALKRNSKKGSAVKDLGCSIAYFKRYMESRFQPGMGWDNYGQWHIDHQIPLSSFDLQNREELLKACHYTNLQPLWASENLSKGDKMPFETQS